MAERTAPTGSVTAGARRRGAPTGGALPRPAARSVRHGLADEARRYLAAVEAFRREGLSISWQPERVVPDDDAHEPLATAS